MDVPVKQELFEKIIRVYSSLPPKKRRVADLIIKDFKKVSLMTAKQVAAECRVSEPTVMRFTVDLGFSGYADFERYLKSLLHLELTRYERLLSTSQHPDEGTTLEKYCRRAMANLKRLMTSTSEADFQHVAQTLHRAPWLMVVGYRASATLAYYFGYLLKKIRDNVLMYTSYSWDSMDTIALLREELLLFVIGFPRYPTKTIDIMNYARQYEVKIIGLSDTPTSPIIALADEPIIIEAESISFVDPFAHIISYLGALVHEIAFMDKEKTIQRLSRIEDGVRRRSAYFMDKTDQTQELDPLKGVYANNTERA